MTKMLFRTDPYLRTATARVVEINDRGGVVVDESIFYPAGGGQPGDAGRIEWEGGAARIATAVKGEKDAIILVPDEGSAVPPVGVDIVQTIDWDRRLAHMRIHTALHLLSVVIPLPVTGGAITADKGRLDFDMPDAPEDKGRLTADLNELIFRDYSVTESWISEAELDANPGLVKTMSVQPPRGAGRIRLVRIGDEAQQIDLQPCGGTHVSSTAEIGRVRIGKIEKKGRQNRRVNLYLDPE